MGVGKIEVAAKVTRPAYLSLCSHVWDKRVTYREQTTLSKYSLQSLKQFFRLCKAHWKGRDQDCRTDVQALQAEELAFQRDRQQPEIPWCKQSLMLSFLSRSLGDLKFCLDPNKTQRYKVLGWVRLTVCDLNLIALKGIDNGKLTNQLEHKVFSFLKVACFSNCTQKKSVFQLHY